MKNLMSLIVGAIAGAMLLLSNSVFAQEGLNQSGQSNQSNRTLHSKPYFGGNLVVVSNNGPSSSDFNQSIRGSGFIGLAMNDNIRIEGGLSQTTDTEDSDSDNTGEYKLEITSSDLFAGVRFESNPMGIFTFFGRGGLLYYKSEIKLNESFYDIKPKGSVEVDEEGTGFYLSGGGALEVAPRLKLTGELAYLVRQDYFAGARRAFDMKEMGVSIGIIFETF